MVFIQAFLAILMLCAGYQMPLELPSFSSFYVLYIIFYLSSIHPHSWIVYNNSYGLASQLCTRKIATFM